MNIDQEKISRIIRKESSKHLYLEDIMRRDMKRIKKTFRIFPAIKFQIKRILGTHTERDVFLRILRYGTNTLSFIERYKYLNKNGFVNIPLDIREEIIKKSCEKSVVLKEIGLRQVVGEKFYQPILKTNSDNEEEMYIALEINKHVLIDNIPFSHDALFGDENSEMDIVGHIVELHSKHLSELSDKVFLYGTGNSEPLGIFNDERLLSEEVSSVKRGIAGYITTKTNILDTESLVETVRSLTPAYRLKAKWMMNSETAKSLNTLKDKNGKQITDAKNLDDVPGQLLNIDILINENMPHVEEKTTNYPVILCNFSKLYKFLVSKKATITRVDISSADQFNFVIRQKFGGGVINPEAIKFIRVVA